MFTLSDDKSAYGTLKGLVQAIQKDIKDVEHKRDNYSPRSLDYARAMGEIGGYNLTLSLIISTDVWARVSVRNRRHHQRTTTLPHQKVTCIALERQSTYVHGS
jgi:hypothetical protein